MKTETNRAAKAMKKSILVLNAVVALTMVGCKESPYINAPGDNRFNTDSIPVVVDPQPTPDPEGVAVPPSAINVNQAVDMTKKLASGAVTEDRYYIKGWVVGFNRGATFDTDFPKYGNDFVYLAEEVGALILAHPRGEARRGRQGRQAVLCVPRARPVRS